MVIRNPQDVIAAVKSFPIRAEYVLIKPNWVSDRRGEYTEAEILDWVCQALPEQKKIVLESYTPWRGSKFVEQDSERGQGVTLEGGKKHWDFYKKQDEHYLEKTGIVDVLKKHAADYVNIAHEVWSGACVDPANVRRLVEESGHRLAWQELYAYVPRKIFDIRRAAIFISLAKIKVEEAIPAISVSMSLKNLFGMIPHPSRFIPFHGENHASVSEVIRDIYNLYTSLFADALWITEGIKTLVRHYGEPEPEIVKDQNLFFVGTDAKKVDAEACAAVGVDPRKVPYLDKWVDPPLSD